MDGKGKVPNRARILSRTEENFLWESGQLACNSSRSLIKTVWWNNCLYFGMKGREEHHGLKIEQFRFEIDENGRRFITYTGDLSKTRNKGLNFKPRLISPKIYDNKIERCPVAFFLLFKVNVQLNCEIRAPFTLLLLIVVVVVVVSLLFDLNETRFSESYFNNR